MVRKLIISFFVISLLLLNVAFGATFFDSFKVTFSDEKPDNMKITSHVCDNSECTDASNVNVEYYKGDAIDCWFDYGQNGQTNEFLSCMEGFKLSGNTLDLNDCDTISNSCSGDVYLFAKYDTSVPFGYINSFFSSEDNYVPYYARQSNFQCSYDYCVDIDAFPVEFGKISNAIAEVGQLNIKNVDNELLPIQIEVPVEIEETVCSAYRFASNYYRADAPVGYDDFSSLTNVALTITRVSDNAVLMSESVNVPIEADTCAGLTAFTWTPSADLQDEEIKFRVETDVIDQQVVSSTKDWAEVIETVYPENLDGSCWTRAYDFTLSNVPSTNMNTSVAQITVGEELYAVFDAGAWRDESMTPMSYSATLYFDGVEISNEVFTSDNDVQRQVIDLTNAITGLSAGQYEVKLVTEPVGTGCIISEDVEQTQNLELLEPEMFEVTFNVRDPELNNLYGADVDFMLIEADDYYVNDPEYNESQITNAQGMTVFNNVHRGDYTYVVSKEGYTTVTNDIYVGGDMNVYVTLPQGNTAPIIELPDNFTEYYENVIEIDLTEYSYDFNDQESDLSYSISIDEPTIAISQNGAMLNLSTNSVNEGVLTVTVFDPSGANMTDSTEIYFIDNQAPVVNEFIAQPDDGLAPFTTEFIINVSDNDIDSLMCTIDFDDGTNQTGLCENLNGLTHTFDTIGTYNVVLTVEDGFNMPVTATEQVFVYENNNPNPTEDDLISYFMIHSSNGNLLPTDLVLEWGLVSEADDLQCTITVNDVNYTTPCNPNEFNIDDYDVTGVGVFTLTVTDGETIDSRTIERLFGDFGIGVGDLSLDVGPIIVPGPFSFNIIVYNETLNRRTLFVTPIISCDNERNTLSGMETLSGLSRSENTPSRIRFNTNTNDFKLKIPTDETCTFRAEVRDLYGTEVVLTKDVVFSYPIEEEKETSITGSGIDIMNYMVSTIITGFDNGYNTVEFTIVNNENENKDLSLTLMSNTLGIDYSLSEDLGPDKSITVQIPIYIDEDVEPGMYPARIAVNDGEDRASKYTYIRVK